MARRSFLYSESMLDGVTVTRAVVGELELVQLQTAEDFSTDQTPKDTH
jgi:hypothetical protein